MIVALLLLLSAISGAQNPSDEAVLPHAVATRDYRTQLPGAPDARSANWRVVQGKLPEGVRLDGNTGVLAGRPTASGEFHFAVQITVPGAVRPVMRTLRLVVAGLLNIAWQQPAAKRGDGIFGEVLVTSYSADPVDLTVIIVAVNETGRATAPSRWQPTAPRRACSRPSRSAPRCRTAST